ncbi:hypothetical protein [Psychrobacter sp. SZ93C1]|uniref:hypothetical protein n=1 Tax=Psychrobacter sp. SZ93C1 TaxID=2792058 RepID=UPI0018CC921E|nr:hypothetical protein [Psychrobacter sp. SZ93C1]MBH0065634.1 hypothetical protein [Psychrobacter sp. SZ93C1]
MSTKKISMRTVASYFKAQKLRIFFAILWALFVGLIITSGFEPNPHALQMLDAPEPHSYDIELVVILVVAMLFHLSFLVTIDVYMRSQWKFFTMLIITTLFLLCFGMVAMHAPPSLGFMVFGLSYLFYCFRLFAFVRLAHSFYVVYSVEPRNEDRKFHT